VLGNTCVEEALGSQSNPPLARATPGGEPRYVPEQSWFTFYADGRKLMDALIHLSRTRRAAGNAAVRTSAHDPASMLMSMAARQQMEQLAFCSGDLHDLDDAGGVQFTAVQLSQRVVTRDGGWNMSCVKRFAASSRVVGRTDVVCLLVAPSVASSPATC